MSDTMQLPEQLREQVIAELDGLALSSADSKAAYRSLHALAVRDQIERSQRWICAKYPRYAHYFANGDEVKVQEIDPVLIEVTESWHADLFRLSRLTWSLPYTRGYGRRLRFLILDKSNNKLIGILGLQSPPIDFPARDRLFHYPEGRKIELVNQTMDIFTLGAIPPYNYLLGGKLVALAASANEVRQAYERRYACRITQMEKRQLPPYLVALTTTSAFGRSSIYNRLKYEGGVIARSIGYTEGFGSFHLARLYPLLCDFLKQQGIPVKRGGFGVGPRIVWQVCVRALRELGLSKKLLKHGLKREIFLFPLIANLTDYMEGRTDQPLFYDRPFDRLQVWWRERWLLPRAERVDSWHHWSRNEIERMLVITAGVEHDDRS